MELWFTEYQTPAIGFSCKSTGTLRTEKTAYQDLAVIETEQFGRMLLLDGMVMTTEKDEFIYHEMITCYIFSGILFDLLLLFWG